MSDFVDALAEMGFNRVDAKKAVDATGNVSVQNAMDWLLEHSEDLQPSTSSASGPNGNSAEDPVKPGPSEPADNAVVRSYKCEDCGKILRNEEEMELHAAKSKHTNFSESTEEKKPLTEEEKKEQMRLIEERIRIKRAEREKREKQEALDKEKMRMKSGKELSEYKKRFEEQQKKEIIEARKREKLEDKQARDRVKAQIEADRLARKAKEGGGTVPDSSNTQSSASVRSPVLSLSSVSSTGEPPVKKEYTETKLQLRLPNGKQLIQCFNIKEPLAAVRLYVELNRDDGIGTPFNLMTNFPRKIFQDSDYDMPLEALGLFPSAVLMVTKTV